MGTERHRMELAHDRMTLIAKAAQRQVAMSGQKATLALRIERRPAKRADRMRLFGAGGGPLGQIVETGSGYAIVVFSAPEVVTAIRRMLPLYEAAS